jgi:hypothetical protein
LSNFDFGIEYNIGMAGLDEAGNVSDYQLSGVVTVFLGGFTLTQGVHASHSGTTNQIYGGAHLAWKAGSEPINKNFSLLYVDRADPGYHDSVTDEWQLVSSVTNSWFVDAGRTVGVARVKPQELGRAMRFYRASIGDKWSNRNPKVASKEIYVAKAYELRKGENWISLLSIPDTNTLEQVWGTNDLPAGSQLANSTTIDWYGPTQSGVATNTVWLSQGAGWLFGTNSGPGGGPANQYCIPLHEGMSLTIPTNAAEDIYHQVVVGQLPAPSRPLHSATNVEIEAAGTYNVVSYTVPYRLALWESGLREAGFMGPPTGQPQNPNNSDELRILARGGGTFAAPKVRILMNSEGDFVYWSGAGYPQGASAENYRLDPDDALIIYTRMSQTNWTWATPIPYGDPTYNMNP